MLILTFFQLLFLTSSQPWENICFYKWIHLELSLDYLKDSVHQVYKYNEALLLILLRGLDVIGYSSSFKVQHRSGTVQCKDRAQN